MSHSYTHSGICTRTNKVVFGNDRLFVYADIPKAYAFTDEVVNIQTLTFPDDLQHEAEYRTGS